MRRIISSVASPALPCLYTLSHIRHDFQLEKKVTGQKMCVLTFSTIFVWNIYHSTNSERYYHKKILKYKISWNPVQSAGRVVQCNQTDRQTDKTHDEGKSFVAILRKRLKMKTVYIQIFNYVLYNTRTIAQIVRLNCRYTSIRTVTTPRIGLLRHQSSITRRDKSFSPPPHRPHNSRTHPAPYPRATWALSRG